MHEFSIIQNLLGIIEDEAKKHSFVKVTKVILRIGKLRQIVPDTMQFAFAAATEDTVAQCAELALESVPVRARCKACATEFAVGGNLFACPSCSGADLDVYEGNELYIQSMEGET
jgi:hydrogenase nickel incorporation protein HypA/HybF